MTRADLVHTVSAAAALALVSSIIVFPILRCEERTMRTAGAFQLVVEPETEHRPMRVTVALAGASADSKGMVPMLPACMSLDVLEGCINALQDELDMVRAEARRAFMERGAGRA